MNTGLDVMDTSIEKTNLILKNIEEDLGWINRRHQTFHALRVVLHALRDRLPVEETIHLSAQLPLFLKGVLIDGWNINEVPIKWHRQDFLTHIGNELKLSQNDGVETITRSVLFNLFNNLDPGETNKIISSLPDDISELFIQARSL